MNKRTSINNRVEQPIYVSVSEIMGLFSIGRDKANQIGIESGSRIKVGKSCLFNVEKFKNYLDGMMES